MRTLPLLGPFINEIMGISLIEALEITSSHKRLNSLSALSYLIRFGSDELLHTALSLSLKVQELCEQASQRTGQNGTEKRSNSATRAAQRSSSFFSSSVYRGKGAGVSGGGVGQDSRAGRKSPGSPMTSLIDKVKQLEGDLTARRGAPKQQLGLLRDLHCRAVDIEHLMTDSLSDQQRTA